jgi:hypothetical protein
VRRSPVVLTCLALLAAATALAGTATAGGLHESTAPLTVPAGVRTVVVDVDAGQVTVRAGTGGGEVHKRWTLQEPEVSSTVQGSTMRIAGTCGQPVRLQDVNPGFAGLDCAVDVTLAVPAGVALDLRGGAVSVSGVKGDLRLAAVDDVVVDHAGPGAVRAESRTATVRLASSHPRTAELTGDDDVVLRDVATASLKALSGSAVSLTSVEVRGPLTVEGVGAVSLDRVSAAGTGVTSSSDAVSLTRSRFSRLTARGTDGVALDGVASPVADLRASPGRVRVLRSRVPELTAVGDDSVAVTLLAVPRTVRLESTAAWVSLVVPRSTYALTTRTATGHVTIEHVVVDRRSPRTLSLIANGDISIT